MTKRWILALAVAAILVRPAAAQTNREIEAFSWQALAVPAVLTGVGVFGLVSPAFQEKVNIPVYDALHWDTRLYADDILQFVPAAAAFTLGFGVSACHNGYDRFVVTGLCMGYMFGITELLKHTVREQRPDSEALNSFPSGHTACAFAGAELVRLEYGPWWGLGAYSVATLTAVMRLFNGRHWLSDVLAGAGIGILCARMACWTLPLCRQILGWDKQYPTWFTAAPFCQPLPGGTAAGMTLALRF